MRTESILRVIRRAVRLDKVKISIHAAEEALEEEITRSEILEAFSNAEVVENYPEWWLDPVVWCTGRRKKAEIYTL